MSKAIPNKRRSITGSVVVAGRNIGAKLGTNRKSPNTTGQNRPYRLGRDGQWLGPPERRTGSGPAAGSWQGYR